MSRSQIETKATATKRFERRRQVLNRVSLIPNIAASAGECGRESRCQIRAPAASCSVECNEESPVLDNNEDALDSLKVRNTFYYLTRMDFVDCYKRMKVCIACSDIHATERGQPR